MAKSARARSSCAAGALRERLRRVQAIRSSGVSGRRGSVWWRDMGHLAARGSPITIPELTAIDPLVMRASGYSGVAAAQLGPAEAVCSQRHEGAALITMYVGL